MQVQQIDASLYTNSNQYIVAFLCGGIAIID